MGTDWLCATNCGSPLEEATRHHALCFPTYIMNTAWPGMQAMNHASPLSLLSVMVYVALSAAPVVPVVSRNTSTLPVVSSALVPQYENPLGMSARKVACSKGCEER